MVRGLNDEREIHSNKVRGLNDETEVQNNMVRGLHSREWDYMVRWKEYDEVTIWYSGQVKQNCEGSYQIYSNTRALSWKRKDKGMETNCYARGCKRVISDQVGTQRGDGNLVTRLCNGT